MAEELLTRTVVDKGGQPYTVTVQGGAHWCLLLVQQRWRAIGHAYLSWDTTSVLQVGDLYIDKPYRDRGLGTALIRMIYDFAQYHALSKIECHVSKRDLRKSPHLLAWLARQGFSVALRPPDDKVAAVLSCAVPFRYTAVADIAPSPMER